MDSVLSHPTASSSKNNTEFSLLLGLPGEIRNKIWEFAVGGTHYEVDYPVVRNGQVRSEYRNLTDSDRIKKNRLALTRTCRQIYEETKTFHVRFSTYHLTSPFTLFEWSNKLTGAESVVVECPLFISLLRLQNYLDAGNVIVEGLPLWGRESTITEIELRVLACNLTRVPDDSVKAEVMAWGEQWRQDVQNRIKAAKDGVRFSFSIWMSNKKEVISFPWTG